MDGILVPSGCCMEKKMEAELHNDFIVISDVIPDVICELKYTTSDNFMGCVVEGYKGGLAILTRPAVKALARSSDALRKEGYRLIVYDAYRPKRAVAHFMRWLHDPLDEGHPAHYPRISKLLLLKKGYLSPQSSHSRGSTVDVGLATLDGTPVDMGGFFDLFDVSSGRDYKELPEAQRLNRIRLRMCMEQSGFCSYAPEWWHFTLMQEPYPNTYFDFELN